MITEKQMRNLFAQANPIPDEESIDLDEHAIAAYLATLEQRSSELKQTDTDERTVKEAQNKTNRLAWGAAAGAIAIAGILAMVLIQGGEKAPPATLPTPTTVADPTPTTTVQQSPSTVAESAWEALPICCGGVEGHYRIIQFAPEFSFDAPAGWRVDSEEIPEYLRLYPEGSGEQGSVGVHFVRLDDSDVQEQVDRLRDTEVFEVSVQEQVAIDGANGFELQVVPRESFTLASFGQLGSYALTEGLRNTIYVLDVNGVTLLIIAQEGIGELALEDIANSIVWKDPGS